MEMSHKVLEAEKCEISSFLKMGLNTRANGNITIIIFIVIIIVGYWARMSDRAKVSKYGLMAQCTKAGGEKTKQMAKADLFMLMEISMMAIGRTIRPMTLVFTAT